MSQPRANILAGLPEAPASGCLKLLEECACLTADDRAMIIYDSPCEEPAKLLLEMARRLGLPAELCSVPLMSMHGQEPPADVARQMANSTAILNMSSKSMAHTKARIDAGRAGARYLSLPEYSMSLLADESLQADFRGIAPTVKAIADAFTAGEEARVQTLAGTDIRVKIKGRIGNACPGFVTGPGDLGSPPDIEANVSPIETESTGVAVIDGSIPYPGLGKLKSPVRLIVEKGRISSIESEDAIIVSQLKDLFAMYDENKTKVLAELGIGLNPLARLTGIMLTDEGAAGTAHFGFGANSTVGGQNSVPFHLDFVFFHPTISVDGKVLLKEGKIVMGQGHVA